MSSEKALQKTWRALVVASAIVSACFTAFWSCSKKSSSSGGGVGGGVGQALAQAVIDSPAIPGTNSCAGGGTIADVGGSVSIPGPGQPETGTVGYSPNNCIEKGSDGNSYKMTFPDNNYSWLETYNNPVNLNSDGSNTDTGSVKAVGAASINGASTIFEVTLQFNNLTVSGTKVLSGNVSYSGFICTSGCSSTTAANNTTLSGSFVPNVAIAASSPYGIIQALATRSWLFPYSGRRPK